MSKSDDVGPQTGERFRQSRIRLIGKYVERLLQERDQLSKLTISIDTGYLQKRGLL